MARDTNKPNQLSARDHSSAQGTTNRTKYIQMKRPAQYLCLFLALAALTVACVEDEGGDIPQFLDLATQVSSLDFEGVTIGSPKTQSYGLYGSLLEGDVTVTTTSPFQVSKSATEGFASSVTFSSSDFTNNITNVYVQLDPQEEGEFMAEITHSTPGLDISRVVTATGIGVTDPESIPTLLFRDNFDYTDDLLPSTNRATDDTNPTLDGWLKVRAANKDLELVSESLTFEGYPESGIGKAVVIDRNPDVPGGQTNLLQHNIDPQQNAEFTGSYYASFLFKAEDVPTAAGGYNSPLIFSSWNPNNGASWWSSGFVVQNDKANDTDPDNMVFGIRYEALNELSDKTMEIGKTYLIVLKHTITTTIPAELETTATSTASIFVFEEGDAIDVENEPEAVYTMINIPDKYYIRSVTLFQENDPQGRYIIDGLRVTNEWDDIFK